MVKNSTSLMGGLPERSQQELIDDDYELIESFLETN